MPSHIVATDEPFSTQIQPLYAKHPESIAVDPKLYADDMTSETGAGLHPVTHQRCPTQSMNNLK